MSSPIVVAAKGAERWRTGHPWIYRSDVRRGAAPAGVVPVTDARERPLGWALWSPRSEIRLRWLAPPGTPVDRAWWRQMVAAALARRTGIDATTDAYRAVHAEADGLPSLVVDRYGPVAVVQLLSAGLEAVRDDVLAAVVDVLGPAGVLFRNDASVRRHEGLPLEVVVAYGTVPERLEVHEGGIRYRVDLRAGQKTGAFLDQRENRELLGQLARGRALDLFTYEGLFALHMARQAGSVTAVDQSEPALELARANAVLNGVTNVTWVAENVFDLVRRLERAGERFDTIVLDPPAFAKQKSAVPRALAGYKEINLRAMRLLAPGGVLYTASCSFHVGRVAFMDMLADAATDSGVRLALERVTGQGRDHPEILTIPETGYLKGAILRRIA
jgi:23S rRNA (cytosine1962-C5)-methyltransferase